MQSGSCSAARIREISDMLNKSAAVVLYSGQGFHVSQVPWEHHKTKVVVVSCIQIRSTKQMCLSICQFVSPERGP